MASPNDGTTKAGASQVGGGGKGAAVPAVKGPVKTPSITPPSGYTGRGGKNVAGKGDGE